MAKKKNKKDTKGSESPDPVETIRAAIERTLHATTDSAAGTQKRSRQLVDEVTSAASRIRATIEELRVLDEVKGLRNDIDALARRVAALESAPAKPPARSTATSRSRSTGTTSRAKTSGTARAKTTTAKSSGAKPAAARKPRTTRSRSTRASGSSSRSSGSGGSSS